MFFARVAPHLEQLSDFVRHQIAYLEAIGDLPAGELTPDDVIDEVLVRAYREFDGNVDEASLRHASGSRRSARSGWITGNQTRTSSSKISCRTSKRRHRRTRRRDASFARA